MSTNVQMTEYYQVSDVFCEALKIENLGSCRRLIFGVCDSNFSDQTKPHMVVVAKLIITVENLADIAMMLAADRSMVGPFAALSHNATAN